MSKILVVEDHAESRYMLEQLLRSRGHLVIAAENGVDALQLARRDSPDLIVSDIMMPLMNGFRLCREIKNDALLRNIPFIFYTATFVDESDKMLALSLGASRFIIKPTEGEQFIGILDEVLKEYREGVLSVPEGPVEAGDTLLDMYDNSISRKLAETVEKLKEERKALIKSEKRLKEAQELAHIGHWELDLKTNSLEWSDELYRILGFKPQAFDASYKVFVEMAMVHPEDRAHVMKMHRDSLSRTSPYDMEYRLLLKDGTVKFVNEKFQALYDDDGRPVRSMGTVQDITERKQAEKEHQKLQNQLSQAQKLESIGALAGGMAHDFNNMLVLILGLSEMALMKMKPGGDYYVEFTDIRKAAIRSAGLTRQLLAFARKQSNVPKILVLNDALKSIISMLRRLIGENIELTWNSAVGLWAVKMDPVQMDQILVNLCINARDAISGTGNVSIKTENVVLDQAYCAVHAGFVPGEYVMMAVSDDGCGMDRKTLEKIFEPFFTTKGAGKGTGLGLSTVFGIVKQNKGFIEAYSEPGQGTALKVYLPRHAVEKEEVRKDLFSVTPARGDEGILLVEDDPMILEVARLMLESLGYRVLAAATPMEAIDAIKAHDGEIQLLVTDVIMPDMNGWELAEKLAALFPNLRCLFMSGYTADMVSQYGALREGAHFIHKPFSVRGLSLKVREVLG